MLLEELLTEMSKGKINKATHFIELMFQRIQIRAQFSVHFMERSTDGNIDEQGIERGSQILYQELMDTFSRLLYQHKHIFTRKSHLKAVIHDEKNNLNIPFILYLDHQNGKKYIKFITIMKIEDFKSGTSKKLIVN